MADLIAKVGADTGGRRHRRAAFDDEQSVDEEAFDAQSFDRDADLFVDMQDTQVIDPPSYSHAVVAEIPEFESPDSATADEAKPAPVRHKRFRRAKSLDAPKPKSRRQGILLAARSLAALVAVLALVLTGGAWQWSASKNHRLNMISALDPHSDDIVDPSS